MDEKTEAQRGKISYSRSHKLLAKTENELHHFLKELSLMRVHTPKELNGVSNMANVTKHYRKHLTQWKRILILLEAFS
jgi:hypothetical protein